MYINVDAVGCPNTCRHCAAGGHAPWGGYYSLDELRSLRAEWVPLTIYFEPTAHPDFPRVYEPDVATDYGGSLVSNGFGLARREDYRQVLEGMHALGIQRVHFTLHGLREHHDWFVCREGAFDDIVLATRRVREAGFTPSWQLFVDHRGAADVPGVVGQALQECGAIPSLNLPYHRVGGRLSRYEEIRLTLADVQEHRLDRVIGDPPSNFLSDPEGRTAAAWLERWEQSSDVSEYMHIFEPRSWPPDVTYEHLCLIFRRDRQVFLDPVCSSPIHLGQLSDGKEAILERLGALPPPPYWDIEPGDVEFSPVELGRLHSCGLSVRYVAISKARRRQA